MDISPPTPQEAAEFFHREWETLLAEVEQIGVECRALNKAMRSARLSGLDKESLREWRMMQARLDEFINRSANHFERLGHLDTLIRRLDSL